ncbi:unnamed protein product, partial [Vitis vinifera]
MEYFSPHRERIFPLKARQQWAFFFLVPSDSEMEDNEVSIRTEHQQEIEMSKASKENVLTMPSQLSCCHICAFSQHEISRSESEQRSKSSRKLCGLIIFYLIFMAVEIVGGIKSNSLAVLTDAAHLLSDVFGFSISLFAVWASGWRATSQQSFGFNRVEVLGALFSVQLIWLIAGILIYEAVNRILHQHAKVNGKLMFAIAAFGFISNLIMSTKLVSSSPEKTKILNINLQGAYLHVMADLIQSVGVMVAGGIIWAKPEWLMVDLVCTLCFSVLVLTTTLTMLRNIFSILMERAPIEIDIAGLENGLKSIKGVQDVHDLHVWAITVGKVVMSCHVIAEPGATSSEILGDIRDYCEKTYRILHVTVQVE